MLHRGGQGPGKGPNQLQNRKGCRADPLSEVTRKRLKGAGGGPRPKIIFNVIFVEGRQSYQMLFTGSKNIDPSRIYRIFKIAKYIQLPCGRALYSRLSQNFKF